MKRETFLRATRARCFGSCARCARLLGAAAVVLATGCTQLKGVSPTETEAYAPGLGEIMSATQMRHLKLWYAGQAANWPLASYEVDELEEGFAEAVHYHPTHKQAPRPLTELVPEFTGAPIAALRTAIAKEDRARFVVAYDELTESCNGCHAAAEFSFNEIARPTANPYTNQVFAAPR